MDTFSKLAAHSVYHQNKKDSLMDTTAVRKCLQWDPAGWFVCTSVLRLPT